MKKLLYIGWLCSLGTLALTIYINAHYTIIELNPFFRFFLGNTYYLIIFYNFSWCVIFMIYDKYEGTYIAHYIAYMAFFIFSFDLIHDLVQVI